MSFSGVFAWICRLGLGGAFLVAGYLKARDPNQFLFDVRSFQLLPDPYAALLAMGLPWLEIFAAVGVLLKRLYLGSLAVLCVSLIMFIMAIAWSWHRGLDISCGCFGKSAEDLSYTSHIVRNAGLLGMGVWLLYLERRAVKPDVRNQHSASGFDA